MIQRAADHNPNNPSTDPQKAAPKITLGKPTPSASWSRLKDPRVVRVSRALGGKDRHSKVFTVRGLRDRRVRLSVPTAIQLYDLQERLGLTQPSKAVDWLLNAAKHEIDELPPLQIPPAMSITGPTNLHQNLNSHEFRRDKGGLQVGGEKSNDDEMRLDEGNTNDWAADRNDQDGTSQVHDLENTTTNNTYNSIFRLDASTLTLSHAPRVGHLTSQHEDNWHNFGLSPLQMPAFSTSMPLGSHHHQPGIMNTNGDFPGFLSVGSASQPSVRSFHFNNMTANLLPLHDETEGSH